MFTKSLIEKNCFKSGFKSRQRITDENCCGSEFLTDGAENWKACLENSVLMNSWSSSGMADENKVWLQAHSAIWQCR